jgi:hypothetical protein
MSNNAFSPRGQRSNGRWFHGTANRDFERFDPRYVDPNPRGGGSSLGVFFTDSLEQGHNFRRLALKYGNGSPDKSDGRVIEAAIRGRFKEVDVPALERAIARERRLHERDAKPSLLGPQREWMVREANAARREGFDGVDFVDIMDDPLSYKQRATHRLVFPHRAGDAIDVLREHVMAPSGVVETTIAAARAEREAKAAMRAPKSSQPKAARAPKRVKYGRF